MIEILSRTTGTASMELIFGHTSIDLGSIFSQPCTAMQSEFAICKFVVPFKRLLVVRLGLRSFQAPFYCMGNILYDFRVLHAFAHCLIYKWELPCD